LKLGRWVTRRETKKRPGENFQGRSCLEARISHVTFDQQHDEGGTPSRVAMWNQLCKVTSSSRATVGTTSSDGAGHVD
jgi:hypothetical protein